MPLYDFECAQGHVTEAITARKMTEINCACGQVAVRRSFYATALAMGAKADWSSVMRDNGFPRPPVEERKVSMRQFNEASEQLEYEHHRHEESAQRELQPPPLARMGIERARKAMRAGITDSLDIAQER